MAKSVAREGLVPDVALATPRLVGACAMHLSLVIYVSSSTAQASRRQATSVTDMEFVTWASAHARLDGVVKYQGSWGCSAAMNVFVPSTAVSTGLAQMAPASVRQAGRVKLARIHSVQMIAMVVAPVQRPRLISLDHAPATMAGLVMHVSFQPLSKNLQEASSSRCGTRSSRLCSSLRASARAHITGTGRSAQSDCRE